MLNSNRRSIDLGELLIGRLTMSYMYQTISFIIFLDFSTFYQIFLSPKVKQCAIITYKHGIYEFPYKLPNDLRLSIKLGNKKLGN